MAPDTTAERLARLEVEVRECKDSLTSRLGELENAVLNLRLHEARMEPFERGVWIVLGVVLSAIGAGLLAMMTAGNGLP